VKEIENHIESIITRKISGEISADEEYVLDKWLVESDENGRYFKNLQKIYSQANEGISMDIPAIDVNQEWQRFKNSVQTENTSPTYQTNWIRIAASIVIIAVLGYLIWFNAFQSKSITVLAEHSGQLITLPDNSVVTLNKDATITYPTAFADDSRIVIVKGEAFFEVTRNEKKPFTVNLGLSSVEVLGTSFNINAEDNNDKIEVVVNTGKVRFSASSSNETVVLTKGEKGTFMKNTNMISKVQNKDVNFMAWKTRKIVFNDVGLDVVIQTVNKIYNSQITFSTDVGKNCKVTVSFDNQSIEAILSVLELTLDLEYKKTGDIIEVVKTGC
jgi:ferric-dicitrate binding protein FerR (iron transport regulator)